MRRNTASKALPGLVAIVVALCPAIGSVQDSVDTILEPPYDVRDFLMAWVAGDEQAAMSYFSTSERARTLALSGFAPRGDGVFWLDLTPEERVALEPRGGADVRGDVLMDVEGLDGMLLREYWELMNEVWRHQADIEAGFSVVHDQEIIEILQRELEVRVVSHVGDEYLVYIADNRESIEQFNAHPDVAETLLGDGDNQQLTLGVLADLPPKPGLPPPGPFVTFWQQEENGEWRIQTIGSLQP